MADENLKLALTTHQFFAGMSSEHLDLLAECASPVYFQEGDEIFHEGGEANSLYVIEQGRVALELSAAGQNPVTIQTSGEGDVLGWSWLVGPHRWRYTARALRVTQVLALDGHALRAKCDENRDFGYELLRRISRVLAHRLEATRLQLVDVYAAQG